MAPKPIRPVFETSTQGWSDCGYADGIDEQRSVGAVAVFLQAQATWSRQRRNRFADRAADVSARLRSTTLRASEKLYQRPRRILGALEPAGIRNVRGGYRVMLIPDMAFKFEEHAGPGSTNGSKQIVTHFASRKS